MKATLPFLNVLCCLEHWIIAKHLETILLQTYLCIARSTKPLKRKITGYVNMDLRFAAEVVVAQLASPGVDVSRKIAVTAYYHVQEKILC